MALFKKKPPSDDGESSDRFEPQPEKASKWFEHARTAAMSSNFDYALSCFANGLKFDPGSLTAHEEMYEAAVGYRNRGGKAAAGKEVRNIDDGTPVGKFAAAEFEWMKDLTSFKSALRTLETAVKADQLEYGHSVAPKVFNLLRSQKKHTKAALLQAMQLFGQVGAWDSSLAAGEMAKALDPTDADLDAELKNLSAQRAMDQGGYERAGGEEGGFRSFIKDEDRQRELAETETLAGGASVEERNLERARLAYEETPTVPDVIQRYAQLLKKTATPEAEQHAIQIYQKAFEDTGEYRFRMFVGDIRIDQLDRRVRAMNKRLEAESDDALQAERDTVRREMLALMSEEYSERVKKYPTDRTRKFELGRVQYELGAYDEAMPHLQAAKDEPKLRVQAGHLLGRCFLAEHWHNEAISEFQEAIQAIDATEKERELSIKYDLMVALLAAARDENSVDLAKEAKAICSEIARRDITYRDIRKKRKEADEVIREVTGGGGGLTATAVIPARYESTRFPGKLLANRTGRPLIAHVHERVLRADRVDEVLVATDDDRIEAAVTAFGGRVVRTGSDHPNGTSRVAEVARALTSDVVVNVQGDEPEIDPGDIDLVIGTLDAHADCVVATVAAPFASGDDPIDPNVVKVVTDRAGRALYFSRAPLQCGSKHLGLYAYRRPFLADYAALEPTPLEQAERLEQLRVLEHGYRIAVGFTTSHSHGIDTPEQYEAFVERWRAS